MIRKYTSADFKYLESWVTDAEILFRFSGPGWEFPLTSEQVEAQRESDPQRCLYVGIDPSGAPYAIGEIIWGPPVAPRLGRILIGNSGLRGQGLGAAFVRELIEETIRTRNPQEIFLFVLEGNDLAIRCYEKVGFRIMPEDEPRILEINGVPNHMFLMVYQV